MSHQVWPLYSSILFPFGLVGLWRACLSKKTSCLLLLLRQPCRTTVPIPHRNKTVGQNTTCNCFRTAHTIFLWRHTIITISLHCPNKYQFSKKYCGSTPPPSHPCCEKGGECCQDAVLWLCNKKRIERNTNCCTSATNTITATNTTTGTTTATTPTTMAATMYFTSTTVFLLLLFFLLPQLQN